MAFYIRKAFKTGPVRLNLSKGGLGLSAGVTGARVGINRRGTYVHGGRHGLYYRKYMDRGDGSRSNRKGGANRQESGPVDLFHDTGVTLQSKSDSKKPVSEESPSFELPDMKIFTKPYKISLGVLAFVSILAVGIGWLQMLAFVGWSVFLLLLGYNGFWLYKAKNLLRRTIKQSDKVGTLPDNLKEILQSYPETWRSQVALQLHAVIGEMAMRSETIDTRAVLQQLDESCPADKSKISKIRANILRDVLDKMLEDHILDQDEEKAIKTLIEDVDIDETYIEDELDIITHFKQIREEMEKPLEPIDPGIPLVQGEEAYHIFEPARLLNERVLNRFQRDNVQYRELGYEIDMEGKLVVTDRRIMLIERGSREYRLNRVVDVTTDPEAGITELVLSNRKNPVLISVENPLLLGARIELVIREKVK